MRRKFHGHRICPPDGTLKGQLTVTSTLDLTVHLAPALNTGPSTSPNPDINFRNVGIAFFYQKLINKIYKLFQVPPLLIVVRHEAHNLAA